MNLAIERKAHVVSITSGGFIADTAKTKNLDLVILPAGMPPRTCLGYSLVQVLNVLYQLALIKKNPLPQILSSAELLVSENESIHQ
jgi:glucose/mannose-6-phosphate isomerase